MDIKEQIEKLVEKFTKDSSLLEKFKKDPKEAVKEVSGGAIPEDLIDKVISGVKAKLSADKLSGAVDALGGLFKK